MRKEYIAWFSQGKHGESTKPIQELVRCKECKYFGKYVRINRKGDHYYVCNKHGIYMTKESYCSEGIRNDNNQKAE